jgi:hypothetical protein
MYAPVTVTGRPDREFPCWPGLLPFARTHVVAAGCG